MQTVSQTFREQEYSGEALFNCILRINDNLVPVEQIASIKIKSPIIDTTTETFYIGTFISQTVTIKFKNLDGLDIKSKNLVHLEIGQSVEDAYTYLQIGEYIIDDLAENYQTTCEITCMDYAVKFKPNIDYSPCFVDGKANVDTIIQYICNYFNVELGSDLSLLPNSNVEVGTYNSTISGKQWLSYLAEIKGCNLKMSRYGKLLFIPFVREPSVEINALESAEWQLGEKFQLSKIVYFDAVRNFTKGNDNGNTLFIRQDNPFVTDESVIDNLANNMLFTNKETQILKEIEITDGESGNKASLQLYGDTFQKTTSGKNLLNFKDFTTRTINGLTITNNGNNSLTLNGTTTSSVSLRISDNMSNLEQGTYAFSRNSSGTVSASFTNILYGYNTSAVNVANITSDIRLNISAQTNYNTYYLWLYIPSGVTFTNYTFKPQLEKGESVTEYEPYTYGPSPNPNYPQEIETVTGLNTINITGKNLLKIPTSVSQELNGLTFTLNEDGSISISGTSSAVTRITLNLDNPIALNGEYTFSLKTVGTISTNSQQQWILRNANNNWLLRPAVRSNVTSSETYTRNDIATKLEIYTASGITLDCTIYPQLEKNSTYTDYEQCHSKTFNINLGTLELCKIGDYQDYIYKEDDKWYIHKAINKITLNGSENWYAVGNTSYSENILRFRCNDINDCYYVSAIEPYIMSNYFEGIPLSIRTQNGIARQLDSSGINIFIDNSIISNLTTFKEWLEVNNPKVYYLLIEPTNNEITDISLIEQLNAINSFNLYNGTNIISTTTSNLTPYLKLKYDKDKNFTIWSLKNKNYGDISLDAWDIIKFNLDDKSYMTYNDNSLTYEMNIVTEISTQIPTKQKEVTTNVVGGDIETNIKMLKTTLDYVKNQISLLIGETSGLTERTNQLVMDILSTQNIFQITGGSNLINNSQFLFPDPEREFWQITSNGSNPYNNMGNGYDANLIGKTSSVAKIKIRDSIIQTTSENIINLIENQQYTLNYSYTQDNLTTTTVQFIENISGNVIFEKTYNEQVDNITNETFTFNAEETAYTFKVTTSTISGDTSIGYFNLYDLMLNSGDKKSWTPAKSEVYSTVVKMSQMGLSVFATGSNIVTLLTSQGFQVRKYANGQIGIIITEFTDTGIITGDIESESISTGKYISTEMMINGIEHHVEYFKE